MGDAEDDAGFGTELPRRLVYRVPIDGARFKVNPLHDLATLMVAKQGKSHGFHDSIPFGGPLDPQMGAD
jgi:hypothetical protein